MITYYRITIIVNCCYKAVTSEYLIGIIAFCRNYQKRYSQKYDQLPYYMSCSFYN